MKDTKTNCEPCGQGSKSKTNDTVKSAGNSASCNTSDKTKDSAKTTGYGRTTTGTGKAETGKSETGRAESGKSETVKKK